ncbi:tRNA-splicing ligase RtcB/release factor H-coupled RctB family protein [Chitinophaga jiangningensis]|uniref:3'-phosphate/5'-hydroxy nucleic acid ligase n=1 Tax=Chitinophaga jiangningensis TaxID=1419482 RepID=A0A1M7LQF6_9BACT|nr:RtcB family protein [Chitinophaga jiangningensis]SHM79921.1 tRNA-splicing ligase RtcB/release factor H-coupled RctB family protein [Chitinophaga jiangningensis]
MQTIAFYCDANSIEANALHQLQEYARRPYINTICAFTDIHYCTEKALPVGVAFHTNDYVYPLITGKDIGCGVMYLKINKAHWLKPFDKTTHYKAFCLAHTQMTDDGLGGGNHFLSIEEDADNVYIICHTGTRNRGIALYQQCLELTRKYALESGSQGDYLHRDFLTPAFIRYYEDTLAFGYQRRKNFCLKSMIFLQMAGYLRCDKNSIDRQYLQLDYSQAAATGQLYNTPYTLEDSIHNHLRFTADGIMHRKGSTEISPGKTVVIPLSMSRGSLLVLIRDEYSAAQALNSCAHGAGRKLSRYNAMKHWKTVLKEKQRRAYKQQFSELLDKSGNFPQGYVQEFDFAYKDASDILQHQPYLRLVTHTTPVVTVKYTEI